MKSRLGDPSGRDEKNLIRVEKPSPVNRLASAGDGHDLRLSVQQPACAESCVNVCAVTLSDKAGRPCWHYSAVRGVARLRARTTLRTLARQSAVECE
jgi:hypothetical protein